VPLRVYLIWFALHVIVNREDDKNKCTENFYRLLEHVLAGFKTLQRRCGDVLGAVCQSVGGKLVMAW